MGCCEDLFNLVVASVLLMFFSCSPCLCLNPRVSGPCPNVPTLQVCFSFPPVVSLNVPLVFSVGLLLFGSQSRFPVCCSRTRPLIGRPAFVNYLQKMFELSDLRILQKQPVQPVVGNNFPLPAKHNNTFAKLNCGKKTNKSKK